MLYLNCGDKMKKVIKILGIIFLTIYAAIAVTLTVFLLNYNKYNITEIKDKSLIIVRDDELKPNYQKGDLVIVTKTPNNEIKIGDKIFFYDNYQETVSVNLGTVINKEIINKDETTFTMDGDYALSSEYVIGAAKTSKTYHTLGSILSILESKFGFLFIIIFPILVLFIYEVYAVIKELKAPVEEDE